MPKGYIVAEFDVTGQDDWETYRQKVPETLAAYGGRFLVWAGASRLIEGEGKKGSLIVIEFDSPKRAMQWYNSAEYQAILPIRLRNATGKVFCVAGVPATLSGKESET
jgi:uncharacterized protein (DUF1330 family)